MDFPFDHERFDVYRVAMEVARWVATAPFPAGNADLRDQALRASRSVVLNIAEGVGRGHGAASRHHLRLALGSAAEASAALDLMSVAGSADQQHKLRRVGAMLRRMGA